MPPLLPAPTLSWLVHLCSPPIFLLFSVAHFISPFFFSPFLSLSRLVPSKGRCRCSSSFWGTSGFYSGRSLWQQLYGLSVCTIFCLSVLSVPATAGTLGLDIPHIYNVVYITISVKEILQLSCVFAFFDWYVEEVSSDLFIGIPKSLPRAISIKFRCKHLKFGILHIQNFNLFLSWEAVHRWSHEVSFCWIITSQKYFL